MRQAIVSLLLALALATRSVPAAIMVMDDEEVDQRLPIPTEPVDCKEQVERVCVYTGAADGDILMGAKKLACLTKNQRHMDHHCYFGEVDSTLDVIVEKQDNKCKDELKSKCGKQIDELKKAVEHTSIIGTLKGAVDVVECIVSHAEDLWDHCKPQKHDSKKQDLLEVTLVDDCTTRAFGVCPAPQQKILGLGYTIACLLDQTTFLGMDCARDQMILAIEDAEQSDDKSCHDELRKVCGKQIDQLKKEIQETSVLGVIKSAVDVVSCMAQNAEDLWKKCKPFEETAQAAQLALDASGTPAPATKKPTHKPTKATAKPTHKPTKKPTSAMITEAILADAEEALPVDIEPAVDVMRVKEMPGDMESLMPSHMDNVEPFDEGMDVVDNSEGTYSEVTSVEINMDACVRSARKFCASQVGDFNASPFDRNLLKALNDCIEANAAAIEAECVSSSYSSMWFLNGFRGHHGHHGNREHGHHGDRKHGHHEHPPCRHPDDLMSNLPVCEPSHHCSHHRKHRVLMVGIASLVFLLLTVKTVLVCKRRRASCKGKSCCQATESQGQVIRERTVGGLAYQEIKSDNAPAVPANNIV